MSNRSILGLVAALTLGVTGNPVFASRAAASVVEALDLETLVQESDAVVLARVIKSWSHYDDWGRIVTDFQMQVERTEKGNVAPGAAIVVRKLGGVVDGRGMTIAGEPGFTDGEVVLLFATNGQSYLRPVGMGQGAMRVFERDGERWARSDGRGMSLVKRGATDKSARSAVPEARKLHDVLADVHALVTAQKKQAK